MRITVIAKPKSSLEKVIVKDGFYYVYTKALPENGKANLAIQKILARHFNTTLNQVVLIFGKTSKEKVFDILVESLTGSTD